MDASHLEAARETLRRRHLVELSNLQAIFVVQALTYATSRGWPSDGDDTRKGEILDQVEAALHSIFQGTDVSPKLNDDNVTYTLSLEVE